MRQNVGWGVVVGAIVAAVAWFGDSSRNSAVSLFPDVVSLVVFAFLATFALVHLLRHAGKWNDVERSACAFGVSAGLVLAITTLLRGTARWDGAGIPLMAGTVAGSLVIVVLLSCSIGVLAFYVRMRRSRVSV